MTLVLVLGATLLAAAAVLLLVRLTIGPTILDRSVALDVLIVGHRLRDRACTSPTRA